VSAPVQPSAPVPQRRGCDADSSRCAAQSNRAQREQLIHEKERLLNQGYLPACEDMPTVAEREEAMLQGAVRSFTPTASTTATDRIEESLRYALQKHERLKEARAAHAALLGSEAIRGVMVELAVQRIRHADTIYRASLRAFAEAVASRWCDERGKV